MSLDHEPLGDMGARGPAQEACLAAMAQEGDRGRPVDGELCDRGAASFKFSVMDVYRCTCAITAPHSPTVNAAAGPISSPA